MGAAGAAHGAPRGAPADPTAKGTALVTRFFDQLESGDAAKLERLLSPAFQLQGADGGYLDKEEFLADPPSVESFEISNVQATRRRQGDRRALRRRSGRHDRRRPSVESPGTSALGVRAGQARLAAGRARELQRSVRGAAAVASRAPVASPSVRRRLGGYCSCMLAISAMSAEVTFIFLLVAIVCFVLATAAWGGRWSVGWLGLALFTVPPAWNALAAS